jgi:hypothetical protein
MHALMWSVYGGVRGVSQISSGLPVVDVKVVPGRGGIVRCDDACVVWLGLLTGAEGEHVPVAVTAEKEWEHDVFRTASRGFSRLAGRRRFS